MQICVVGTPAKEDFSTDRVAVAAIDAIVGNVMLVAEGNRLLPRHIDVGVVGGLVDGKNEIPQPSQDEDRAIDRHLGDRVRAAMEDLRHRTILPDAPRENLPRHLLLRRPFLP